MLAACAGPDDPVSLVKAARIPGHRKNVERPVRVRLFYEPGWETMWTVNAGPWSGSVAKRRGPGAGGLSPGRPEGQARGAGVSSPCCCPPGRRGRVFWPTPSSIAYSAAGYAARYLAEPGSRTASSPGKACVGCMACISRLAVTGPGVAGTSLRPHPPYVRKTPEDVHEFLVIEAGVVVVCILLNGFFALSEMALVSSNRLRLLARKEAAAGARPGPCPFGPAEGFFPTVQVGITLVGVFTGAFGGATLAEALAGVLRGGPGPGGSATALALGLVVAESPSCPSWSGNWCPSGWPSPARSGWPSLCAPAMTRAHGRGGAGGAASGRDHGAGVAGLWRAPGRGPAAGDRGGPARAVVEAARTGVLEQGERRMVEPASCAWATAGWGCA
jgi:hypothetical protein